MNEYIGKVLMSWTEMKIDDVEDEYEFRAEEMVIKIKRQMKEDNIENYQYYKFSYPNLKNPDCLTSEGFLYEVKALSMHQSDKTDKIETEIETEIETKIERIEEKQKVLQVEIDRLNKQIDSIEKQISPEEIVLPIITKWYESWNITNR